MNNNLDRLQKQLLGDGPAEKQVLLMKLLHEFETAPHFGEKYVADASSAPQQWIARIGALLSRVGLEHKIAFKAAQQTTVQYWSVAREPFRKLLLAAAEEIKLELELDGHEDIGQVYGSQQIIRRSPAMPKTAASRQKETLAPQYEPPGIATGIIRTAVKARMEKTRTRHEKA